MHQRQRRVTENGMCERDDENLPQHCTKLYTTTVVVAVVVPALGILQICGGQEDRIASWCNQVTVLL